MNKTLIVRTKLNESNFSVTCNKKKILALINWADKYQHGIYDGIDTIVCDTPIDFIACRKKAIYEGLLNCVSKDEIKARFAASAM